MRRFQGRAAWLLPFQDDRINWVISNYLAQSASSHKNLCPHQVLDVWMGRYAAQLLGLDPLQVEKRLLAIVETDGGFATGVSVAAKCSIASRNLRIEDL